MTWFYDSWPLIFRTYYSDQLRSDWFDRLTFIPLGYSSGLLDEYATLNSFLFVF